MCEQEKESMKNTEEGDESLCTEEKTILIYQKSSTEHNGPSGLYIQVLKGLPH